MDSEYKIHIVNNAQGEIVKLLKKKNILIILSKFQKIQFSELKQKSITIYKLQKQLPKYYYNGLLLQYSNYAFEIFVKLGNIRKLFKNIIAEF